MNTCNPMCPDLEKCSSMYETILLHEFLQLRKSAVKQSSSRIKRNILHNYCTPPMGPCWSFQFSSNKLFVLSQVDLMSVTYLSLGNTFGCFRPYFIEVRPEITFCFCQFEISTLRSSTCSFCLFLSLVILLHVRKYLYVLNSLIIYTMTCQKSPKKTLIYQ